MTTQLDLSPIESDPDQFAQECDIDTLHALISMSCDLYYNGTITDTCVSDYAYDALLYWYNKKTRHQQQENAKIGAQSTILTNVVIGKNSVIGAHSCVVDGTIVPDNELWAGAPAKFIKKLI